MMQKAKPQTSFFSRLLREPLLHFLIIGGLLFLAFNVRNADMVDDEKTIIISAPQIEALSLQWQQRWQRPPTADELQTMIEHQIRDEVLYREAVAMGLDRNDPIVRKRLAQKIGFIFSGLAEVGEPTDAQLQDFLDAHAEKYALPARLNLVQIYFNIQQRGKPAWDDARRTLDLLMQAEAKTGAEKSHVDLDALGDRSMLARQYRQVTRHDVQRLFGEDFAREVFAAPIGRWQGPVESSYGLHLIRVVEKTTARLPALAAVRERVRQDWLARQRKDFDEAFYQGLRERYEIVVEDFAPGDVSSKARVETAGK